MTKPFIHLQSDPAECGIVALEASAAIFGIRLDRDELKEHGCYSSRGLRVSDLKQIASELGLTATAVHYASGAQLPARGSIVLVGRGHYLAVGSASEKHVDVFDPRSGWASWTHERLKSSMAGLGLEVSAPVAVDPRPGPRERVLPWAWQLLGLRALRPWSLVIGVAAALCIAAAPALTQRLIDGAGGDSQHTPIYMALAILAAQWFATALSVANTFVTAALAKTVDITITRSLLQKISGLPATFFARQPASAVAARIDAVGGIRDAYMTVLTQTGISLSVGMVALCFAAAQSPAITAISITAACLGLLVDKRLRPLRQDSTERLSTRTIDWRSRLQEFVQVIQPLRNAGVVDRARSSLEVTLEERLQAERQHTTRYAVHSSARAAIQGLGHAAVMLTGAVLLANGTLSAGGLIALMGYLALTQGGIGAILEILEIRVNLRDVEGRIRPFLRQPPTRSQAASVMDPRNDLEIDSVSFAYGRFAEPVIDRFSLTVERGECVAIVAPSGTGKSTLAKLITGALEPTSGSIRSSVGAERSGRAIATVLQDDKLITGSVYDNISFFRDLTQEQVEEAARIAGIDSTVSALPMRYETLISDSFEGLSGGQRQRVLLARAIAGKPDILILDEATSALDVATERSIMERMANLEMTRIMFTHRTESISAADRVVELGAASTKSSGRDIKAMEHEPEHSLACLDA